MAQVCGYKGVAGCTSFSGRVRPAQTVVRTGRVGPTVHRLVANARRLRMPVVASSKDFKTRAAADATMQRGAEQATRQELSYSRLYDEVYSQPLNPRQPVNKPSKQAQAAEPSSKKLLLSDVHAVPKHKRWQDRDWSTTDLRTAAVIAGMHLLALAAPFTFSWPMFWLFLGSYFVTGCLGITLSYHRQLAHKSFQSPKWFEYMCSYFGLLTWQGDPIEWVSCHRYHHLHTDTPLDPHSPYEGFWWSHLGWFMDTEATMERISNRSNASDLEAQPWYRFLAATNVYHLVGSFALLYALGGFPALVWGGALRVVWVFHITWFVNSASHVWGTQTYNTGDLSRNNWWVAILAWGEGWHNNHHAFEFSARHGLEWWQFDTTWILIQGLEKLGLATSIKLPTEKQKQRLAFKQA